MPCQRQYRTASFYPRIIKYLIVLLIGIIFPVKNTYAAYCTAGTSNSITLPSFTQNINALPVNSQIGSTISSTPAANKQFTCGTTTISFGIYTTGNYVTTINGQRIFSTNIPGIGYAIGITGYLSTIYGNISCPTSITWIGAPDSTTRFSPQPAEPNNYFNCELLNFSGSYYATFHLQFYKTAAIVGSGTLDLSGQIFLAAYNGNIDNTQALITTPSNVINTSCSTFNITPNPVVLPAINSNQLSSANSTAGSTPFSININCPTSTNLYITLTDKNNIGQSGTILTPDSSSTSKGVGIQLRYNGNIVGYGPDSMNAGNTNQFFLANFSGAHSFPFTAFYIRTTGPISAGTLSSTATFTFSYQ